MPLLTVSAVSKHFPLPREKLFCTPTLQRAVEGASISLREGEVVGLVGESGSGKTTLARMIVKLLAPTSGQILFQGEDVWTMGWRSEKKFRKNVQIIFQNPFASLDPRQTVRSIIEEGLHIHFPELQRCQRADRAAAALGEVGIPASALSRFPHEFSGGQRQRIAIARALIIEPQLLVLDEPVSSLDVTIQAQVLELLRTLQRDHHMTYLFISHDLHVVRLLCERLYVMQKGEIVEEGETGHIFASPKHSYTQTLLDALVTIPKEYTRKNLQIV